MRRKLFYFILSVCVMHLLPSLSLADWIHFEAVQDWNQADVLEETEDAYIVRLPKKNIKEIRRETPSAEGERMKEENRKILWEEDGSFITLRLPKEAIQSRPAERISGEVASEFPLPETGSLEERLARVEEKVETASFGEIKGKVLQGGKPLSGCIVKIVTVSRTSTLFSGLFSTPEDREGPWIQETQTGLEGIYHFKKVPPGEYDVYWKAAPDADWVRRLSEYPDIVVIAGEVTQFRDIETQVQTIN